MYLLLTYFGGYKSSIIIVRKKYEASFPFSRAKAADGFSKKWLAHNISTAIDLDETKFPMENAYKTYDQLGLIFFLG